MAATSPSLVVIENRTNQLLTLGIAVGGSRVTKSVRLEPGATFGPVASTALTVYTRRLAESGRITIRPQN